MSARSGFGLVELVVALTIVAVGVLGLAATALTAQRAFMTADALQRATAAATMTLDSLLRHPEPAPGQRVLNNVTLRWTVSGAGRELSVIDMSVELFDGNVLRTITLQATHNHATAH